MFFHEPELFGEAVVNKERLCGINDTADEADKSEQEKQCRLKTTSMLGRIASFPVPWSMRQKRDCRFSQDQFDL